MYLKNNKNLIVILIFTLFFYFMLNSYSIVCLCESQNIDNNIITENKKTSNYIIFLILFLFISFNIYYFGNPFSYLFKNNPVLDKDTKALEFFLGEIIEKANLTYGQAIVSYNIDQINAEIFQCMISNPDITLIELQYLCEEIIRIIITTSSGSG